jgi:adenylylsulfate kinase-like enzyme
MRTVVSLNGADNVGKSTHLRWLTPAMTGATWCGTIDSWHPRWAEVASGDFAHWWFQGSPTTEHVQLVFDSHARRRERTSGSIMLEDRGWPMLVAMCAATAVVKDGLSARAALAAVELLVAHRRADLAGGMHILLRHAQDPSREAELALAREVATPSRWYGAYQRALAEIVQVQARRGDYTVAVVRADRSILDIQREIRAQLAARGVAVRELPTVSLSRVWVLAGLSESGKSTVGELMRDEHGAARLKIGYLLEVAAARAGVADPYTEWDELAQAEQLAEELVRFAAASKALVVTVESAHRWEATRHLRRVLGDVCQLVYLRVDPALRSARAAESLASLWERDGIKIGRGADRLEGEADWVIDNSGGVAALKLGVARMVRLADRPRRPVVAPPAAATELGEWLARAVAHLVDQDTAAVLATGSTNTSAWITGWSDIDLLVVRDDYPLTWLRRVSDLPAAPGDTKVAVTWVTTDEVAASWVVPRLVHALRQVHRDPARVLYCREGFAFAVPTLADDDRASRGELALVVMTLRRLLAAPSMDVRAVHKHVLLVMKIVLRAGGTEADAHDDVVAAFTALFPRCAPLPRAAHLLSRDHPDGDAVVGVATAAIDVLRVISGFSDIPQRKAPMR